MAESLYTLFVFCGVSGIMMLLTYDKKRLAPFSVAVSVVFMILLLTPIVGIVKDGDISELFPDVSSPPVTEEAGEYYKTARRAYSSGIKESVCERFSITDEDVEIYVEGFDFERMSATRVKILLKNKAVFKNVTAIEEYVRSLGVWECVTEVLPD